MLGFRVFDRAAGMLSILILARLLQPEHFGIVALASTVVAFVELLSALGLDTILIQRRDLTRAHYDTAWTIQLGIAAVCATLLALAAVPSAMAFREPRLAGIVYVLAVSLLVEGFTNIRLVDFRREMRFDKEFAFLASRRVASVIVTTAAAFALRNEWALAIGMLSSRLVGVVLSYGMRPSRPRFSLEYRREFFGKSSWLLASNLVMFVRNRTAHVALGRFADAAAVGTYTLASDLANMVGQELVAPINRVALPHFSLGGSRAAVGERFDGVTGQVAIALAPLGLGMVACADLLVPVLFGEAWIDAVDVLRYLALAALVAGLASNIGIAFLSLGQYRANAAIHAVGALSVLPLLAAGVYLAGAPGAAMAVLAGNAITALTSLIVAKHAFDYGPWRFLVRIWRPISAATLMYLLVEYAGAKWFASSPEIVRLVLEVGWGAIVYAGALWLLWGACGFPDGPERYALRLVRKVLARFLPMAR